VIEELRETLGRESFLDREVTRLHEVSDALCRAHRAEIDAERERAYASERALHEQIAVDQARISDLEQIAAKHRIYEEMSNSDRVKDTARRILKRAIGRIAHPHTAHWPTISIVTPCYNAEATIEETVRSVLGQGYPHLQYIVQDGGSTDGTLEILEKYKDSVAVFSAPDGGMYDALAKGFAWTTGEVMGYLNADDTLEPGGLWRVAETFRNKPKTAVLYHEDVIQTNGWRTPNIAQPAGVHFFDLAFGRHILFQDGVWWRRHCYEAVHGVDPSFKLAGDYDLWLRMSLLFPFTRGEGHVSCFRKRQGQLSESADAYWEEVERAKKTLRGTLSVKHHARRVPRWIKSRTARVLARLRGRAFFYPLNPGFGLPPVDARPWIRASRGAR
jgi:glycosyltransferase involved in cell wall biosynthesis